MKQYLFLGDTHGDLDFVVKACEIASMNDNAEIIQVGDWGFLWPGGSQLKQLSGIMQAWNLTMRFIDGNHDWHPKLRELAPTSFDTKLAPNIIYQPRGSCLLDEDGTKFVFMGGAPSIDKNFRRDGFSWWAEEEITEEDMKVGLSWDGVDVLVTHDAPAPPPKFVSRIKNDDPSFRSKSNRSNNNVKELRTKLAPKLHVHGHWHHAYVDGVTRGLDCNYARSLGDSIYLWKNV